SREHRPTRDATGCPGSAGSTDTPQRLESQLAAVETVRMDLRSEILEIKKLLGSRTLHSSRNPPAKTRPGNRDQPMTLRRRCHRFVVGSPTSVMRDGYSPRF